mgnify:CR=1 FL=1
MRAIKALFTARWFLTLIGALILSAIVWFVGPLIAIADVYPLTADWVRMVVILVILVIWGLWNLFAVMRQRKREAELEEGLAEAGRTEAGKGAADASAEEIKILNERLDEAVETLKRSGGGKKRRAQYLYELPWYILIGPPGSGKTTVLLNSGLRFPLGDDREASVRGVAGTRNCDWWFADEAILLDTAGRYTTQDSDPGTDAGAWKGFLGLLRKTRPRQPINGALVAISITDIIAMDEAERQRHAQAVRSRLSELQTELGVRFPVYVMITKCDLLSGFVEFFDDLGREERQQVWGMTFPFDDGSDQQGAVRHFEPEFDRLIDRLTARAMDRVQQELDIDRRATIFGFPTQVAALRDPLSRFLDDVFRPSRLETRFLLRGVYFTSGTQEGRPIDRVMSAMGRAFGLSSGPKAEGRGGRAYFIQNLLQKVAFAEAGLVNTNPRAERREKTVRVAAIAAALLVMVAGGVAWAVSYFGNEALIAEVEQQVDAYETEVAGLTPADVNRPDPARVVEPLNTLRDLPAGYADDSWAPIRLTFGLYQGGKLGAQGVAAYRRALEELLLPTLVARLEEQIADRLNRPDFLFEALKVYLMLVGEGPADPDLIEAWMTLDWERQLYPGPENRVLREDLTGHLEAMLEEVELAYPADGALVRRAREVLLQQPQAERAYAMIKGSSAAQSLPDWVLTEQVGRTAEGVLERGSGLPLDTPIDGLLTKRGFYGVFLPAVGSVVNQVNSEAWVLGQGESSLDVPAQNQLRRRLMQIYYANYVDAWRGMLNDLQFTREASVQGLADLVNDLASPTSPFWVLLEQVAAQTTLTEPPGDSAAGAASTAADVADAVRSSTQGRLERALEAGFGDSLEAPGKPVEDSFRELHRFMSGAGADGVRKAMDRTFRRLEQAAARGEGLRPGMADIDAAGVPSPLDKMVRGLSGNIEQEGVEGARQDFKEAWNGQVADACRDVISGRYPFSRGSSSEVPLADFARLFGPGGLLESFYRDTMQGMVDTSGKPWKWREGGPDALGLPDSMPDQFRKAEAIRTAFFGLGGTTPTVTFSLQPVELDPTAEQTTISVDGAEMTYAHGPVRRQDMKWPGDSGVRQARVSFRPPASDGRSSITINGPWALFRLLDQADVQGGGSADRLNVTFRIGNRYATWGLNAHSVENPFALRELRTFRCPPRL